MKTKNIILVGLFLTGMFGTSLYSQSTNQDGFLTFEHQDGDTTYLMKQYFICFLKEGPNREQEETKAAEIQKAHLAHLSQMAADRKICMAGPFGGDGEIKGILIMNVPNKEEAEALAAADPAVKAGRLVVEIHPWWAAVGSQLF